MSIVFIILSSIKINVNIKFSRHSNTTISAKRKVKRSVRRKIKTKNIRKVRYSIPLKSNEKMKISATSII